jgi:hypothetical protein
VDGGGLYREAEIPPGGEVRVLPGATISWYPAIEPRFRASWQPKGLTDAELSGALGLYDQRVAGISDRRDASSIFTAWVPTPEDSRIAQGDVRGWWRHPPRGGTAATGSKASSPAPNSSWISARMLPRWACLGWPRARDIP